MLAKKTPVTFPPSSTVWPAPAPIRVSVLVSVMGPPAPVSVMMHPGGSVTVSPAPALMIRPRSCAPLSLQAAHVIPGET